ncbi:alpha/beta hydrolase [Anaerobacillus alkaliphilus]|uniref:Alpha/beta hydrolase n=1 Tax=Anaerobacillus alkaliphilus TaxID=1548597 RepID=A0A4Q0VY43_9BACI|nr:alpha/beta hydrolase [Anaerobacillus alkaliphilus]RXJ04400.1 alpha/beta hydrolase [Anaerobacillus alkaliphilus]
MTKEMLVKISDFHLFARITGSGNQMVVLESGYGDDSSAWDLIVSEVSEFAEVLVYDRAGLGKSERSTSPRTSREMVKELHILLHTLELKPPYIFVGHSFGGVNVRLYATEYPEDVAGLVLVDTTPEDYRERFLPTMPKEFQDAYNQQFVLEGNYSEFMESLQQVKYSKQTLSVPLVVLAAGKKTHYSSESQALWNDMQREMLGISSKAEFVLAEKSAHYIQNDEPDLVVQAIKMLVNQYISK